MRGAGTQNFEGGFAIDGVFVDAGDDGILDELLALLWSDGADLAVGRTDQRAFHDAGSSCFVEEGNEGFTDGELGDGRGYVQFRIGAKGFSRGFHRFLILGSEGAQGVLHAIAELAEDRLRNIETDFA